MSKCPICYKSIEDNPCICCVDMTEAELLTLKAKTYDSIIKHLFESGND